MYRFAIRGRWLIGHVVVFAIAGLFIWLGLWQFQKAGATRDRNAKIRAREAVAPADFGVLFAAGGVGDDALYRRVSVAGRYDASRQFVVLYRSLDEQPGALLLTPLVTADEGTVIVNRGWFPSQEGQPSVPADSAPPEGEVRVTGLLLAGEGRGRVSAQPGPGGSVDLTSIDLIALKTMVPYAIDSAFVQLQTQDPAQPDGSPRALPPPDLSSGPYFSYAIQWFLFTAVGLVGWPLLIRRAARDRGKRVTPTRSARTP